MLARHVEYLMANESSAFPYKHINWSDEENVAVVANFESAMALEHKMTPAYHMRFSTNPAHVPAIKKHGISHVSLANNHSLDYGIAGYFNAVKLLNQSNIATAGCASSLRCDRSLHFSCRSPYCGRVNKRAGIRSGNVN